MINKDMSFWDAEIGRRIRMRRLEINMSQQRLGDAIGLSYQQVGKYEKGKDKIGIGRLRQIAKALDVPTSFFLNESDVTNVEFTFLKTALSLRLVVAFARIQDRRIQQQTVELLELIAGSTKNQRGMPPPVN